MKPGDCENGGCENQETRASGGSRTRNPRITNAVLCQLKLRWRRPAAFDGVERPESRKNSAETGPASRDRAPHRRRNKKSGASDSAGAPCHGHAGQGQVTARPERSRRPHLEDVFVLSQWVSGTGGPRRLGRRCIRRAKAGVACKIFLRPASWPVIFRESARDRRFFAVSIRAAIHAAARSISPHRVAICVGLRRLASAWPPCGAVAVIVCRRPV
jgi:hypothetical protein